MNQKAIKLWDKLIEGDITALGDLYDLYVDNLFSYGIQLSSNKSFVKDCIHDLFLDLYKYRKKLSNTTNVKYYLFRSLKNKIINQSKGRVIPIADEFFIKRHDEFTNSRNIEEVIIDNEFQNEKVIELSNAITKLSKKQRQVLFLRFTEDKEYEEIARIMNVSVQTSRTIIYRAIKELRKLLTYMFF